jgi:pyruvate dehydrogenase E1 component alpha subunit
MSYTYFSPYPGKKAKEVAQTVIGQLGPARLIEILKNMVLIRQFEIRGEAAYLQGLVGGFYHSYAGQEAIQTAALASFGKENWFITTYRCHALALLLGASPNEIMAELYGRATGNAKGRGGSMHLYTNRLLGGFGIVGGHLPIAIGAAFSLKYQNKKDEVSLCFMGEGSVAQGAFHESLNLSALWNLPAIFVIENNQWGMGTHVKRAISVDHIAEKHAISYGIKGYTFDGMDFFNCYAGFEHVRREVLQDSRPVLIECICERFRGHSISDPGLYRSKEELQERMKKDPILALRVVLEEEGLLDEKTFKEIEQTQKNLVLESMKYAENSPWPSLTTLEEDVYAP